jgi:hypothetical protein
MPLPETRVICVCAIGSMCRSQISPKDAGAPPSVVEECLEGMCLTSMPSFAATFWAWAVSWPSVASIISGQSA